MTEPPYVTSSAAKASWIRRAVRFQSRGAELAGLMFYPTCENGKVPGLVIVGPYGSVKEQSPVQYATRLARLGYACLIFDAHGSGESAGIPIRSEGPEGRLKDIRAAFDLLSNDPAVDGSRLGGLGICQGASYMMLAAEHEPRMKGLNCVSGQYLYRENLEGFFGGGGPTLDDRIARGSAAKDREALGGMVEYIAVISPHDRSVALPWPQINDWYARWAGIGWGAPTRWENRVTASSDADVWAVDVRAAAAKLEIPTLIIHGEQSDGFVVAAQTVFDTLAVSDRKLVIVPGIFHTRFYDDPEIIDNAVNELTNWMGDRL